MSVEFLQRAAERSGFRREYFLEKDIPTVLSNVVVVPFFGDLRSTWVFSSLILRKYQESLKGKYLILASWPGFQSLFRYVNEYWSIRDFSWLSGLTSGANNFYNTSSEYTNIQRSLFQHFEQVISDWKDVSWRNGGIKRFLPNVLSMNVLSENFKQQIQMRPTKKLLIYPVLRVRSWQRQQLEYLLIPKDFWVKLCERLLREGWTPVIYQNHATYDLSPDLLERCLYLVSKEIAHVLCAMRTTSCVLDVHSGISRLAVAARCPFVAVDERQRYVSQKEYEIDDLCDSIIKQYIFSFATQILTGSADDWETNIFDPIIAKLNTISNLRQSEQVLRELYEELPDDKIRERQQKKLGVKFISKTTYK